MPGVKQITYSATGAQAVPSTSVAGGVADISVTLPGVTVISFAATDNDGNVEQMKALTVQLDKTAPAVSFGSRTPEPSANGWNNSDVSIPFTAIDQLSGVAMTTPSASPLVLSDEGAAVTGIVRTTDIAGNTASYTSPAAKIDKTPPVTTASPNPVPNAAGWNNANVVVTLTSTDSLSGLARIEFNLDSAGWKTYAAPLTIAAEGLHALEYRSVDQAGNADNARTFAVKIDKTAPEAFARFDPDKKDLLVFGRDGLSGAPAEPIAATTTVASAVDEVVRDDDSWKRQPELLPFIALIKPEDGRTPMRMERRTYKVTDAAGNTETLVILVRVGTRSVVAQVLSIQYNGGPLLNLPSNRFLATWATRMDGTLVALVQSLTRQGSGRNPLIAAYLAGQNKTLVIDPDAPRKERVVTEPGLVLLRDATKTGQLFFEY